MPTEEQREAVREQIERLTQALFLQDGETVIPDAPGSAVLGLTWAELIAHHKIEMMATRVDWLGFDAEQEWDVVQNVLDGKDRFHWMDGIATDRAPEPPSTLDQVMEAVGNNHLPDSIRAMEDEYHRSLSARPTPANEAKSDYDRMMEEATSRAPYVTRSEGIER